MRRPGLALAAALALLGATEARAEDYLSLAGGRALPLSYKHFNSIAAPGYTGGLEYFHQFGYGLGLGLQADYLAFRPRLVEGSVSKTKSQASAGTLTAIVRWAPFFRKGGGPYALAGFGANRYTESMKTTPNPGYVWVDTGTSETRTTLSGSSTGAAYVLGAGLDLAVSPNGLTFGAEARWHYLRTDQKKFGGSMAKAFTVVGRVGVRFWN
ncbi:MAG: outer membrane beta-barrel protein [Elusimicrobia bacterium]|nr:outer membrane beta-barrel protein [Elusimicrobiota bacterium]